MGRVTLYGHFTPAPTLSTRCSLAPWQRRTRRSRESTSPASRERRARLVASLWQIVDRHRALLRAAQRTVGQDRIQAHHEVPLRRVEALIRCGRREGAFRTDQPT